MKIESAQLNHCVVMKLEGRMDAQNAREFEAACEDWMAKGETRLVLDLGEFVYVSSMGLRSFLMVAKKLEGKGGGMRLCRMGGLVRQVFEITNLLALFQHYDSSEAAVSSF